MPGVSSQIIPRPELYPGRLRSIQNLPPGYVPETTPGEILGTPRMYPHRPESTPLSFSYSDPSKAIYLIIFKVNREFGFPCKKEALFHVILMLIGGHLKSNYEKCKIGRV